MRSRQHGFTLIEVMISLAIFSTIAAFSYATFSSAARESRAITENNAALAELQRTLQWLTNDLLQYQPRGVREPIGTERRPALMADIRSENLLEITRGGHANPLGLPRASAQRVAYRMDEDRLVRLQWPVLDPVLASEPDAIELMTGIERIQISYLGDTADSWTQQWPGPNGRRKPRAVEVIIEHERWGEFRRLLETGY
ncbi:MAG: type II secretion system minor pseudopilin GspJ [Pseudomonadota bacterium]